MKKFEFVVSNGAPERPSASVRSHAVRSGLQRKNKLEAASGCKDAQLTTRQKSTLKGRFKVTATALPAKKNAEKNKDVAHSEGSEKYSKNLQRTTEADCQPTSGFIGQSWNREDSGGVLDTLTQDGSIAAQSILCARWEINKSPSQGWGDPFNSFTVPQNADIDKLMKFFISRFDLEVAISYVQKQWWGYAVSDPLVMHTTLGVAAATWSMFINKPSSIVSEGTKQKGLALRGVQERLEKRENSNALVGAIANLANMEGIEGAYNVARVHLQGLSLLIKNRGGHTAFETDVNIARAVNWSDLQAAAGLDMEPLFPLILPLDSVSLPASVLAAADRPSLSHLKVFETSRDDTTVRFNFALLRQAHYALKTNAISPDDLRILINAADHQLATSLADSKLSDRSRLILTAARAFFWVVIRETRAMCSIPRLIVGRLKDQLQEGLVRLSADQNYWHGLLWCLAIGSSSAWESGENWDFYSSALSNAFRVAQIQESMELEAISRRFLWDEMFPGRFINLQSSNLFRHHMDS